MPRELSLGKMLNNVCWLIHRSAISTGRERQEAVMGGEMLGNKNSPRGGAEERWEYLVEDTRQACGS